MLILAFSVLYNLIYPTTLYAHKILINKSSSKNSLTAQEIKLIFLGKKKQWNNGIPIQVFVYKEEEDYHIDFCREIVEVPPITFRTFWSRNTFIGNGRPLKYASSPKEMLEIVSKTSGAIGYILKTDSAIINLSEKGGINVIEK